MIENKITSRLRSFGKARDKSRQEKLKKYNSRFLIVGVVLIVVIVIIFSVSNTDPATSDQDKYIAFTTEIYNTIQTNYWESISDNDLADLFKLASEKVSEKTQDLSSPDKIGVEKLVENITRDMDEEAKKYFVTNLNDVVLANLQPFGRSRLYTSRQEQDLKNTVQNIDESTDLYQALEIDKDATQEAIEEAYNVIKEKFLPLSSQEARDKLAQAERAYEALSKEATRQVYDEAGAEPTVIGKHLTPSIVYIKIGKMSPISFNEFQRVTGEMDTGRADSLILDLRGNIGGAIDILPYFLGPFIGQDAYAYDFFQQGEKEPFKTITGWLPGLVRYKKVVVLIDGETQSSAEVMAATIKKYNVGVLIGAPTKGWGTVERAFPIETIIDENETYSAFLVHHLTLRNDGEPIEGRGVDPVIYISDASWESQLYAYFENNELISEIRRLVE